MKRTFSVWRRSEFCLYSDALMRLSKDIAFGAARLLDTRPLIRVTKLLLLALHLMLHLLLLRQRFAHRWLVLYGAFSLNLGNFSLVIILLAGSPVFQNGFLPVASTTISGAISGVAVIRYSHRAVIIFCAVFHHCLFFILVSRGTLSSAKDWGVQQLLALLIIMNSADIAVGALTRGIVLVMAWLACNLGTWITNHCL